MMIGRSPGRSTPSVWRQAGSISDEALVDGVAIGDADAVEEFIARFERRVYGAALTIVRDVAMAEEVTQDAFVRVWRHAATYDPRRGSVPTWLMRITHNLCVDALRVRRPVAVDPMHLVDIVDDRPDPIIGTEATDQLRAALSALPTEQARCVVMAAMYGYNAQVISELDRIPLGTAKTRIRLGMAKLRGALESSTSATGSTDD